MFNRKDCKKNAKAAFKKHYILFVFLCLLAAVLGTSYTSSYDFFTERVDEVVSGGEAVESRHSYLQINDAITNVLSNNMSSKEIMNNMLDQESTQGHKIMAGHVELGRMDGVFAGLVNRLTSGAFIIAIISSLYSVLGSSVAAAAVFIILAFLVIFIFWAFVINVFKVIYARMFMEGRIYKKVPMQRIAFLIYVKKWRKAAITMFLKAVYINLWQLTIIGGIIKKYSYFAVPYIVAENPEIDANKAITLSRRMMNGHKWECFVLGLTFIGWDILDVITIGLVGIFYYNPYREATLCEYYTYIRECAKNNNIEGVDELKDTYLYELPSDEVLANAYGAASDYAVTANYENKGIFGKLCDFFGVYFRKDGDVQYDEYIKQQTRYKSVKNIFNKEEYATKLFHIPEKKRFKLVEHIYYNRRYSVWTVILMFALFSFIGWIWEVSLHLVEDGTFVNRGVLHGPWLPIYGTGGVLILLVLNKLRTKPVAEFFSAIVLCGFVEYFIGLSLEMSHGGQKWWSYEGFFLNIDGRVCAEGLLVFGIGGMIVVYFIAPFMDNLIRKIPQKVVILICVVFLAVFGADKIYSSFVPNTGKGITSYNTEYEQHIELASNN